MAIITGGTTGRKTRWTFVDILVVVYALIPVLWTLSLSFKTADSQTDKSFFPKAWTFQNYKDIFATSEFVRTRQLDRHRDHRDADRGGARHDGRLRHRAAGLPREAGARRRLAADRDVPAGLARLAAVRDGAQPRAVRHVGRPDPAVDH